MNFMNNLSFSKQNIHKLFYIFIISTFLVACGSNDKSESDTTYYKKQNVTEKKLALTIEASGIIEAISSVEIKSKASGEVLYLGAAVGDFVEKGSILGQIDQLKALNIL